MTVKEAKNVLEAFAHEYKDAKILSTVSFNGKQLQTLSEAIAVVLCDEELKEHFVKPDVEEVPDEESGD